MQERALETALGRPAKEPEDMGMYPAGDQVASPVAHPPAGQACQAHHPLFSISTSARLLSHCGHAGWQEEQGWAVRLTSGSFIYQLNNLVHPSTHEGNTNYHLQS